MYRMRPEQIAAFSSDRIRAFVGKTLPFLEANAPNWCAKHSMIEREQFVMDSIEFARRHELFQEISIQRLIFFQIRFSAYFPLSEFRSGQLARKEFAEKYRLDALRASFENSFDPTVVELELRPD